MEGTEVEGEEIGGIGRGKWTGRRAGEEQGDNKGEGGGGIEDKGKRVDERSDRGMGAGKQRREGGASSFARLVDS